MCSEMVLGEIQVIETKECAQCHEPKVLTAFHRRKNKTDGRMKICAVCYQANIEANQRQQAEAMERRRQEREEQERKRRQNQEQATLLHERHEQRQQQLAAWYAAQSDRECHACKKLLPARTFGYSIIEANGIPLLRQRCEPCHQALRERRYLPCCVCQKKIPRIEFVSSYRGFRLDGGGTSISLCCKGCETALLALPEFRQRMLIRSCCNRAFPAGQIIYTLVDPQNVEERRYVGRTGQQVRRHAEHIRHRSPEPGIIDEGQEWYTRSNWVQDLYERGLGPKMLTLKEIEVAPQAIEWEYRYIYHGLQHGWKLVNMESTHEHLVSRVKTSQLDFLHASFEALVQEKFFSPHGIEAFIRTWYQP